jgi:homocysteine S-methyltransferase
MPAVAVDEPAAGVERMEKVPVAEKSRLGRKLAAGEFVTLVEILPPRGLDASREIAGARLCKEAGIDGVNVPDGPRASARLSAQITCQLIQQETGIEPVLHFSCRDRNIVGIQSELLGAQLVGIRNLICITGDPPRLGVYPDATAVLDVDSIGLTNIVNNLNHGMDLGGNPLGSLYNNQSKESSSNLDTVVLAGKIGEGRDLVITFARETLDRIQYLDINCLPAQIILPVI